MRAGFKPGVDAMSLDVLGSAQPNFRGGSRPVDLQREPRTPTKFFPKHPGVAFCLAHSSVCEPEVPVRSCAAGVKRKLIAT